MTNSGTCGHIPCCPAAHSADRYDARVVARYESQGWAMLCNGILVFGSAPPVRAPRVLFSLPDLAATEAAAVPNGRHDSQLRAG